MGTLTTVTLGGRPVSIWMPDAAPEAVVYAGDGQVLVPWGADLEQPDLPPTAIVGTHRLDDETARIHEYSPGFDPERFAAHEQLFVTTVRAWATTELGLPSGRDRTAIFGVSASGELALALGLRHPDVYGAIFCASPGGGYRPPGDIGDQVPRAYLVGGSEEPWFKANAERWHRALPGSVMFERPGDHGDPFWREELPAMVRWAYR